MLEEHNCLKLTALHVPKLRYTVPAPKVDPSPTFYKITQLFQYFINCVYDSEEEPKYLPSII